MKTKKQVTKCAGKGCGVRKEVADNFGGLVKGLCIGCRKGAK